MQIKAVLISEDEQDLVDVYRDLFSPLQCNIIYTKNGLEALESAKKENIDLLITDLRMPHSNGEDLISEIKKIPKYAQLPIIVISGNITLKNSNDLAAYKNLFFIQKPFDEDDLVNKVKGLLLLK